jgi:cytochrome c-type biogenesis protein CcmH
MRRLALVLAALVCMAAASDPADRLPDPGKEARARALFTQVRCMVCQNESIDDSDAELAADLRRLVREQVSAGRSDTEVKAYLVSRYGEFVLLKPALSWTNGLLWGAPILVLLAGGLLLRGRFRPVPAEAELSEKETARLNELANGQD